MDEVTGESRCPQRVMVSNAVDTRLITQYINTTLSSGRSASEVEVDIQFTCTGDCSTSLHLLYYPTNTEQNLTALPSDSFTLIGPVVNGSNPVTGITAAGFYLSVQATGSISVIIHRISVIATFCGEQTVNLISFPEAYPTTTLEAGSCSIANSEPMGGGVLTGTCGNNGNWATSSSCVCSAGYFLDNGACTGTNIYVACAQICTCTVHAHIYYHNNIKNSARNNNNNHAQFKPHILGGKCSIYQLCVRYIFIYSIYT